MKQLDSTYTLLGCQSLAGSLFAVLAIGYFYAGLPLLAGFYLCGALLLMMLFIPAGQLSPQWRYALTILTFLLYTLIAVVLLSSSEYLGSLNTLSLHLAFPLLAFSLLPFRPALILTLGFAVTANLLGMLQLESTLRASFLVAFWLITLLTSVHHFAHLQHQQGLKDYLYKDPSTGLFNSKLLRQDLHKEIERAKREHTHLALLHLESKDLTQPEAASRLQTIQQTFAPYERLYQVSGQHLVALLPLGCAEQLEKRLLELAEALKTWRTQSLLCNLEHSAEDLLAKLESNSRHP